MLLTVQAGADLEMPVPCRELAAVRGVRMSVPGAAALPVFCSFYRLAGLPTASLGYTHHRTYTPKHPKSKKRAASGARPSQAATFQLRELSPDPAGWRETGRNQSRSGLSSLVPRADPSGAWVLTLRSPPTCHKKPRAGGTVKSKWPLGMVCLYSRPGFTIPAVFIPVSFHCIKPNTHTDRGVHPG